MERGEPLHQSNTLYSRTKQSTALGTEVSNGGVCIELQRQLNDWLHAIRAEQWVYAVNRHTPGQ
jgi:hypothetical protein